jgi:hypothetical protein
VHGRDAALQALVERVDDAVFQLQVAEHWRSFSENELRALVQLAGRLAGLWILADRAARGVGTVLCDLRQFER